jgi:hypothetical protein
MLIVAYDTLKLRADIKLWQILHKYQIRMLM